MPAILAGLLAALGPWIARYFLAKGVLLVVGLLARFGLVLATDKYVMEPLIQHVIAAWNQIPADWQCWFALLGITKAASIVVSGLTLISMKKVFFAKKD
ncbi:hypothetical protein [Lysobacter sp. 1R34A]|uniref:hypothetical protein n=1 Tax=Lysobacter sp. 1R34A TaxID=3445786 RepID=UPI003EEE00E4